MTERGRRWRAAVMAGGLVVGACGPPSAGLPPVASPEQIAAKYQRQADQVMAEADGKSVWATCPPPKGVSLCGIPVSADMLTKPFVERFVEQSCSGIAEAECESLYRAAAEKELAKRYPMATRERVLENCEKLSCDALPNYEFAWLVAHNDAVHLEAMAKLKDINQQHKAAQQAAQNERDRRAEKDAAWEARRAAVAQGFQAIGAGLSSAGNQGSQTSTAMQTGYTPRSPSYSPPPTTATYSPPSPLPPPSARASAATCSSDFQCGFGNVCVKGEYQTQGTCAKAVDRNGTPTYTPPRSESVGPGGPGNCRFGTDCPVGFQCIKNGGSLTGNCMK